MSKKLTVDGREVSFTDERNLLEVIRKAGFDVPTLCYRSDLSIYGACRMCVVEIEGRGIQTSCTVPPEEGMKVTINTERTRRIRKVVIELLLKNHDRECTTCERSGSCDLQNLSNKLGVKQLRLGKREEFLPLDESNPSVVRDQNKCILCGACIRACKEIQGHGVLDFANRGSNTIVTPAFKKDLSQVDCIYCGQCVAHCPTAALRIKSDIDRTWKEIHNKDKVVVAQIAPAVRAAVAQKFNLDPQKTVQLIAAALRRIGFDKVFDTSFSADLTIMEEGTEFVTKFTEKKNLPLFTSCCPAWVRFAEQKYPQYLSHLSTCRSPQQMFGSVIKELLPKELGTTKENIVSVSIMPCTAKKAEAVRPEFQTNNIQDVDIVLTTQELIKMIEEAGIDFAHIEAEEFDSPFGLFSGAGVIFGASGGVAEAAVRTAYELITKKKLEKVTIKEARGINTLKEIILNIEGQEVKIAIVNTLIEAEKLIERLNKGEVYYDMVEVMACPGGCVGGAGQPQLRDCCSRSGIQDRADDLYEIDVALPIHKSHENEDIKKLYKEWLEKPNSHSAHKLLHTHYKNRKRINSEGLSFGKNSEHALMNIEICIGSCCYKNGSYKLMDKLNELIQKQNLQDKVNMTAVFCFENCSSGPNIKINGEFIEVKPENAEEIFNKYILAKVK